MIVIYVAVAVLCFVGSARGGALPDALPEPCPGDEPCELNTGGSGECVEGECGFYIADSKNNQCPYDNTHTLLAHPTDCRRYCRCDHSGTAICDMPCAPGTRFDGKQQVCVHDDGNGCSGVCSANPCVNSLSCYPGQDRTPWSCPCNHNCYGWNCQFAHGGNPCEQHVCCPPGFACLNEVASHWPLIPYTCIPDPCASNPCLENGVCVPIKGGRDYRCDGCPAACYGKNCDCQRPDPCDTATNCVHGTCTSPNRDDDGKGICGTFTCTCDTSYYGVNCNYFRGCDSACSGVTHANVPNPFRCDRYCACGLGGTVNDMPCPAGLYFNSTTCACSDRYCTQRGNTGARKNVIYH